MHKPFSICKIIFCIWLLVVFGYWIDKFGKINGWRYRAAEGKEDYKNRAVSIEISRLRDN